MVAFDITSNLFNLYNCFIMDSNKNTKQKGTNEIEKNYKYYGHKNAALNF